MTRNDTPEVGDLVVVTFDKENGLDNQHRGQVKEVDEDPDREQWDLYFALTDEPNNTEVQVVSGVFEGEDFASVSRYSEFSGDTRLGTDAEWEVVA